MYLIHKIRLDQRGDIDQVTCSKWNRDGTLTSPAEVPVTEIVDAIHAGESAHAYLDGRLGPAVKVVRTAGERETIDNWSQDSGPLLKDLPCL